MYLPSGVTTLDIGSVSSAICLPTGWRRQPLLSRKPPVASGPTCSRGAVCELKSAPRENRTKTSAMRLRMEAADGFIGVYNCIPGGCGPRLQQRERRPDSSSRQAYNNGGMARLKFSPKPHVEVLLRVFDLSRRGMSTALAEEILALDFPDEDAARIEQLNAKANDGELT